MLLLYRIMNNESADYLLIELEERGLGWSLDSTGRVIEARIWKWPEVIGRYRPDKLEPLSYMISQAMNGIDWTEYPKTNLIN